MKIILENIGKRYKDEWVFSNINYEFLQGKSYLLSGPNGSGKSTLLNIISTRVLPTSGKISFENNPPIKKENTYKHISVCSPYIELIEEFSLIENVDFFLRFKNLISGLTTKQFFLNTDLSFAKDKLLSELSSGMKQRFKLGLAILAASDIVLLDEPCVNLDENGMAWYQNLVNLYKNDRMFIVSSNNSKEEAFFCEKEICLSDFK